MGQIHDAILLVEVAKRLATAEAILTYPLEARCRQERWNTAGWHRHQTIAPEIRRRGACVSFTRRPRHITMGTGEQTSMKIWWWVTRYLTREMACRAIRWISQSTVACSAVEFAPICIECGHTETTTIDLIAARPPPVHLPTPKTVWARPPRNCWSRHGHLCDGDTVRVPRRRLRRFTSSCCLTAIKIILCRKRDRQRNPC